MSGASVGELVVGLVVGLSVGLSVGLVVGLSVGLVVGLVVGLSVTGGQSPVAASAHTKWLKALHLIPAVTGDIVFQ
jgi:hypothetical protein